VDQVGETMAVDYRRKAYGATLPALTVSYAGFVNGDSAASLGGTLSVTTTGTAASAVGSYPITASGYTSGNYTISYVAGALSVDQVALTVTANNKSKAYGAALPALTVSYAGFVNGDSAASLGGTLSVTTTGTAASAVGTYPISASGYTSPNYTIGYVGGTLSVDQVALTVTANDKSKAYGAALPALTVSYAGFVNGDSAASLGGTLSVTTTGTAASAVGTYPISASGYTSPNYTIGYVAGALTVDQVALTVTANDKSKAYGAALPALTVGYAGFVNGDSAASLGGTLSVTTTGTAASAVGTYPISANGYTSPNYTIGYVAGTLTVDQDALRVAEGKTGKA